MIAQDSDSSDEPTPEHAVRLSSGQMVCAHCGGKVDGDGYSDGGEVGDDGLLDESPEETRQHRADDRLGDFARSVMGRRK
jgi:hypothetical protein